jgi:hypothetical protein
MSGGGFGAGRLECRSQLLEQRPQVRGNAGLSSLTEELLSIGEGAFQASRPDGIDGVDLKRFKRVLIVSDRISLRVRERARA